MKVYQLIYTATRYSLSDPLLNLENRPGYKVFSCTQGLTKEEIDEIVCFCSYKRPDSDDTEYSREYADPEVPESFPKIFRTFMLSTGKYAAVQVAFSGVDMDGKDGNFFAHAFVFDETYEGFMPELYYGSEDFRTHLTEEETNISLVRYLPALSDVKEQENLLQWLDLFAKEHRIQMSALIDAAVEIFSDKSEKTHLCVSAQTGEESDYYILALKRLLPKALARKSGISTNNTYLPSDKQNKILLNATVSGENNITDELIEERSHCIYIDFSSEQQTGNIYERLFEVSADALFEQYERFGIDTVEKFSAWLMAYNRVNQKGISKRLQKVLQTDPEMFKNRCLEIYSELDRSDMTAVKFEVLNVMYDNIEIFTDISDELTKKYIMAGFAGIVNGEPVNMEGIFSNFSDNEDILAQQSEFVYESLDDIMEIISSAEIDETQAMLLLRMFAIIKQAKKIQSWKEFFKDKLEYMQTFVAMSATVIINDTNPVTFIAPIIWTNAELSEVIAYFDSSTDDVEIKKGCRKYILSNIREDWSLYGIEISKEEKSREDRENDIKMVRKMLSSVGYVPFYRGKYQDLKFDVLNDMATNDNPLLITRLLNAFYNWQITELEPEAKQYAQEMKAIILEMREKENSCYKFIFPKFALEMLSLAGIYHEMVINCETMQDTFWNWFLIGANKNINDETVFDNYSKVFEANKRALRNLAIYLRLEKVFK